MTKVLNEAQRQCRCGSHPADRFCRLAVPGTSGGAGAGVEQQQSQDDHTASSQRLGLGELRLMT